MRGSAWLTVRAHLGVYSLGGCPALVAAELGEGGRLWVRAGWWVEDLQP